MIRSRFIWLASLMMAAAAVLIMITTRQDEFSPFTTINENILQVKSFAVLLPIMIAVGSDERNGYKVMETDSVEIPIPIVNEK